jgi:hypothetical protein
MGLLDSAKKAIGSVGKKAGAALDYLGTNNNLPEFGLSEAFAGGKQTQFTGYTNNSKNAGFVRNYQNDSALNVNNPKYGPVNKPNDKSGAVGDINGDALGTGGGAGGAGGASGGKSTAQAQEEAQLKAEEEAQKKQFKDNLSGRYSEAKTGFNNVLGEFSSQLNTLPGQIDDLTQSYKSVVGEKKNQELSQVEEKVKKAQTDQRKGILAVAEDAVNKLKQGSAMLSSRGAGNSSAAGMFQAAIQKAANAQTRSIIEQAANIYKGLENDKNKVTSTYDLAYSQIDNDAKEKKKVIQSNLADTIEKINNSLRQSGEYERLDGESLDTIYYEAISKQLAEVDSQKSTYKQQVDAWKSQTENNIAEMKNRLVQEFIPQDINYDEIAPVEQAGPDMGEEGDGSLSPLNLKKRRNDLENPRKLADIIRSRPGATTQG